MRTFLEGVAAIRGMDRLNTDIDPGRCKQRTREAFGVPSNGTQTAADSWAAAPDQHHNGDPTKAPAYSFGWMTGGGSGAGHVVVNLGAGRILTPGGPRDDDTWCETTAAELLRGWPNLTWVGWTYTIDGAAPVRPPVLKPPRPAPAALASFLHLASYAANDSLRGVRQAARRRGKARAIDLNWHLSADLVWVNTHWATPLKHGFTWDATATPAMRRLPASTPVHKLTWEQIRHLIAKSGRYRINRAETVLALAEHLGVRVEFEDKGGGGHRREAYRRLFALPSVRRLLARGLFLVKTLVQIPGAAIRLAAVKFVNPSCPTLISTTNAKSKRLSVATFGPVADMSRGDVVWVA